MFDNNQTKEILIENSLFLSESNEEVLNEGAISALIQFLSKGWHIGMDINENERQFNKLVNYTNAVGKMNDVTYKKYMVSSFKKALAGLGWGVVNGLGLYLNVIPILGQLAYGWINNKTMTKYAISTLKSNISTCENFIKETNKKIKTADDKEKKDLMKLVRDVESVMRKMQDKLDSYEEDDEND